MTRAIVLAAVGTAAVALASATASQTSLGIAGRERPEAAADPNRGRMITIGGIYGEQRISCVQCHGLDGSGNSSGAFPRLTDQSAWYLYKALRDYAAGLRPSEIMGPIAQTLTDREMQDVAAHYASVKDALYAPRPDADVQVLQIGGAIAAVGIPDQGVPACNGCHGSAGVGAPPIYPYLAGQYEPYTRHQLMLWKQGRRDGDSMDIMEMIAKAMTEDQIRAVSVYYAFVRPAEVTPDDRRFTAGGAGRPSPGLGTGATDLGAMRNPQPGPVGVVPGAEPSARPAPSVEAPVGLPRRPLPPNALPPYLSPPLGERLSDAPPPRRAGEPR